MKTLKENPIMSSPIDDNKIIELYMIDVLENNHATENVYLFCKKNNIEESQFYNFFGSFEGLKQEVWVKFYENAQTIMMREDSFLTSSPKDKLLTFYYTLFEILNLNRSYVLYTLKENKQGMKNLNDLKKFRNHFKNFIVSIIETSNSEMKAKIDKVKKPVFSEGSWVQFLFILKFWMDDSSKGFEKTDIVIEKSVNTAVDLFDTKPLENLFDLGKFLWKERRM